MSLGNGVGDGSVQVPEAGAAVEQLLEFAGTYNAYELFARTPDDLGRIAMPIYEDIARSGRVPDWIGIDLARAVCSTHSALTTSVAGTAPMSR